MPSSNWKELYNAAMLETTADKLPARVEAAREAIHQFRMQRGKDVTPEEREEIDSALRALFTLLRRRA
jgi:hypothetical protein